MKKVLAIQNQILYERFKNLADKSFDMLDNYSETLPYELKRCITITYGGGGSEFFGYTPCFWGFIERYKDELTILPEFALCIEAIQQDKSINKDIEIADFLIQFLTKLAREKEFFEVDIKRYLDEFHKRKNEMLRFNIDNFNKVYSRYEKYLYSDRQVIAFAPLRGFESESEDIDLGNFFKIRRMPADELTELWYDYYNLSTFSKSDSIRMIKFCIVTEQKSQADINTEFNSIITSLRLWKKGSVGYDTIYYLSKWSPLGGRISGSTSIFFGHPPVVLKSTEVEEFKNFYVKFNEVKISDYKFLDMAINRFNYAYERKRQEDKLVDYMIAFEALFMKETQELQHRLSVRIARFLEGEYDKRKDLFLDFKRIYDLRSKIVHGESINHKNLKKLKVESLSELISKVEEQLRESIKRFIDLIDQDVNYNHEEFLDKLDLNNV